LIAAVMEMFPVFVPFSAPTLSAVADTRLSSRAVSDRVPTTSVPRLMTLLLVFGANVTIPLGAAIFMLDVVLRVMLSDCNRTLPLLEVIEAEFANVPARYVTSPELTTVAAAVIVSTLEVDPTSKLPTLTVEPAVGKFIASEKSADAGSNTTWPRVFISTAGAWY
jgi:hypothetical protein